MFYNTLAQFTIHDTPRYLAATEKTTCLLNLLANFHLVDGILAICYLVVRLTGNCHNTINKRSLDDHESGDKSGLY
jgi:hypothetical protein